MAAIHLSKEQLMRVGIGYCNQPGALQAGRAAAGEAMREADLSNPELVIAFCGKRVPHDAFLQGVREITGDAPVIGGSAVGVITNKELSYKDHPAAVAVLELGDVDAQVACAQNVDKDEELAGNLLAAQFTARDDAAALLVFHDSIKIPASPESPPVMNASPPLIAGIESALPPTVPIIGAGLVRDYELTNTEQFCGADVNQQSVVGALLSGPVDVYHTVMHGCSPIDGVYRTITKIEGSVIYELDGRPIVDTIDDLYGSPRWREQHPLQLLTIGANYGDRFEYQEDNYVNRLITGILPDGSGVGIFEPDLEQGTEIQFMLRDGNMMTESAKKNAEALMKQVIADGRTPAFGLYIDCAGRAAGYSNTETEEAAEIQHALNEFDTPLLGFYSGVEIAPIAGRSRGLDWTGVLTVFALEKKNG